MPKKEELLEIKQSKLKKEEERKAEELKKAAKIKAEARAFLSEIPNTDVERRLNNKQDQSTYIYNLLSNYVTMGNLGTKAGIAVDPEKKIFDDTMDFEQFSQYLFETVKFKFPRMEAKNNGLSKAIFNLLQHDEDGAASELIKSAVIKNTTDYETFLRAALLAVEGKEDTLSEEDKKSLDVIKKALPYSVRMSEFSYKMEAGKELVAERKPIIEKQQSDLKKYLEDDNKAREEAIANYKEGDPVKVYVQDILEFVREANREERLNNPLDEKEVLEELASFTSDAERMQYYQNLIVKDKCCKLWEYQSNDEYKKYLTPEIRNSSNPDELKSYYMKNLKSLNFIEKAMLLKRIHAIDLSKKIQNANETGNFSEESMGSTYLNERKFVRKENGNIRMEVYLPRKQTSLNGCWSCGLELMLRSHGIKVEQEEIRSMRADFDEAEKKKEDIDKTYYTDRGKDISAMADSVLPFAPDKMIRSFEVANPLTIQMAYGEDIEIDHEKYLDAATEAAAKKIRQVLNEDKCTISFTDGNHYFAITDIYDDGRVSAISSLSGKREVFKLKDAIRDAFEGRRSLSGPLEFTLVWMSNIELEPDGKHFYNVPSHYLSVNQDGSLNLPPEHEHRECEAEKSAFEKNGIRVKMVGGVDDTAYDRTKRNPFGKENILLTERAYLPKKLNYKTLKRRADARTPKQEAELLRQKENLLGKDFTPPKRDPNLTEKDMNKAVEDWLKEKAKKSQDKEFANRVRLFEKNHGLSNLHPDELQNSEKKVYLWNKSGALVAFKIEKSFHAVRKFYEYMKEHDNREKWSKGLTELDKEYAKFRQKIHAPENAITDEVKPDIYTLPGYFKSNADIVWGLNFMNSIADKIAPSDFKSTRAKFTKYEKYNPNMMIRFGENIREFADEDSVCNLLKACAQDPEFNEAVNMSLIMPTDEPEVLNKKFRETDNQCLKDYTDFSLEVTKSILKGNPQTCMEKVKKFKDTLKEEGGAILPNVREYVLTGKLADPAEQYLKEHPIQLPEPKKEEPKQEEPKQEENKNEINEEPKQEENKNEIKDEIKEEPKKVENKSEIKEEPKQEENKNEIKDEIKEEPKQEDNKNEINEEPGQEAKERSNFEKFKLAYKDGTLFTQEQKDYLNHVCEQMKWAEENLLTKHSDLWNSFRQTREAIDFLMKVNPDSYKEHTWDEKVKVIEDLTEALNRSGEHLTQLAELEKEENPRFGRDAKDLFGMIELLAEKTGSEDMETDVVKEKYYDKVSKMLLSELEPAEPEGLGTTLFNPKFVAVGKAEDLTDEQLAEAEKAFDTVFKSVVNSKWFDLKAFNATNRDFGFSEDTQIVRNTNTKRDIQIGKANILCAMMDPRRSLTYTVKDPERTDGRRYRVYSEIQNIELSEETIQAQKEYKENIQNNLRTEIGKIMDSEEISRFEFKMDGKTYDANADFPIMEVAHGNRDDIMAAADFFDRVFKPIADLSLPERHNVISSFYYAGEPVLQYVKEMLPSDVDSEKQDAIAKAYVLHMLIKEDNVVFAPKVFDENTKGFHTKKMEEMPLKLKVSQIQRKAEEQRLEAERQRLEQEQREREERERTEREQREREEQENRRQEELRKKIEEENLKAKEEFEQKKEEHKEQVEANNQRLRDDVTTNYHALKEDYKDAKYTHRGLALPAQDAETYLDRYKAADFLDLSSEAKRAEVSAILKNAGVAEIGNPKVLSSLLVIYALGVQKKSLDDLENMSPEEKKQLGTAMLSDFNARPVIGTLPGSKEKAEENLSWYGRMVGAATDTWYHRSDIMFPELEQINDATKFNAILKNEKFGLAYDLALNTPKLTANWEGRSSKPTEANPYGVDFGFAFSSKYAGRTTTKEDLSEKIRIRNNNQDAWNKDHVGFMHMTAVVDEFRSIYHNDPSNPYQYRLKATQNFNLTSEYYNLVGPIDNEVADAGNYDAGYHAKGKQALQYSDSYMKELDKLDENSAKELLKYDGTYGSKEQIPENLKAQAEILNHLSSQINLDSHAMAGTVLEHEVLDGIRQVNESDHSEILNLPFNAPENIDKEPDYQALMNDPKKLEEYGDVFDRIFDPIRYSQKKANATMTGSKGTIYNDFGINFVVNGESVKDISQRVTGIDDRPFEYSDAKKRNNIAKVIVLHAMANGNVKLEYAPSLIGKGHATFQDKPVAIKNFTHEMKAQMDAEKQRLKDVVPVQDANPNEIVNNAGNNQINGEQIPAGPGQNQAGPEQNQAGPQQNQAGPQLNQPGQNYQPPQPIQMEVALNYIENLRDHGFPESNPSRLSEEQKQDYADKFLKIIAVRQLADSERGKKGKLVGFTFTEEELNARVNQMKHDYVFKSFIKDVLADRDKFMKAIFAAQCNPGHGGKLDDMLKEHMLNIYPGYLDNTDLHKRFLPTVKERIESIQNQVKQIPSMKRKLESVNNELLRLQNRPNPNPAKLNSLTKQKEYLDDWVERTTMRRAVAEIIELRNLSHADLGKKESLEKKIPAAGTVKLSDVITSIEDIEEYRTICNRQDVFDLLQKGHGGAMTVLVRAQEAALQNHDPELVKMMDKNTIGRYLGLIEKEAEKTVTELQNAINNNSADKNKLVVKGKLLIEEYLLLKNHVWDETQNRADLMMLKKDVPWSEVKVIEDRWKSVNRTGRTNQVDYSDEFKRIFRSFGDEDILSAVRLLADAGKNPNAFLNAVTDLKKQVADRNAPNNNPENQNVQKGNHGFFIGPRP